MRKRPLCMICLAVMVWILLGGKSGMRKAAFWMERFGQKEVTVQGELDRQEKNDDSNLIYLKNNKIFYQQQSYQLPKNKQILVYTEENKEYRIGNRLQVRGRCDEIEAPGNPGQFDSGQYYLVKGIVLVIKKGRLKLLDGRARFYPELLRRIKERLRCVLGSIAGQEDASVFSAMLLGDKKGIDPGIKELYQDNGIAHILAISGLHISMIGMGLLKILKKLGLPLHLSGAAAGFIMVSYGIMTGAGVSTLRAVIMFLVYLAAGALGRTYDSLSALALSAVLLLLGQPEYLKDAGFLLSFSAVLGAALLHPIIVECTKVKGKLAKAALLSLCIQVVTLPIVLYFYFETPLYGVFLNLLVIPLMGAVLAFGMLGAAAGLVSIPAGIFLISPGHYILTAYKLLCEAVLWLPCANIITGRPRLWQLGLYYAGLVLLCLFCHKRPGAERLKLTAGGAALILALTFQFKSGMKMTFLDVGQGDAICIEAAGTGTLLIDGGSSDVTNVGSRRIEPFLKYCGISKIDYLLLSHMDADHVNGTLELLEAYRPNLVQSNTAGVTIQTLVLPKLSEKDEMYKKIENLAIKNKISVLYFQKGDKILSDRLSAVCLHPDKGFEAEDKNEGSMVLQVEYQGFKALLTGDIQGGGEEKLIESGLLEKVDVLKVAHHGSENSTPKKFLELTSPAYGIISCGKENRYGHPHPELLLRLEEAGAARAITWDKGAIQAAVGDDGYQMYSLRDTPNSGDTR